MATNYYDIMASGDVITYANWNSMIEDIWCHGGISGSYIGHSSNSDIHHYMTGDVAHDSPINITNGNNRITAGGNLVIGIDKATSSTDGYLGFSDFNNFQSAYLHSSNVDLHFPSSSLLEWLNNVYQESGTSLTYFSGSNISGGTIIGNTITTLGIISSQTGIIANYISANASNLAGTVTSADFKPSTGTWTFVSSQNISGGSVTTANLTLAGGASLTYLSSQSISSNLIIGDLHYPYGYIIYKDNDIYYSKNTRNGAISSSTDAVSVFNYTIKQCSGQTEGGIFINEGTYQITGGSINIDCDGITLKGVYDETTLTLCGNQSQLLHIYGDDTDNMTSRIIIEDIEFQNYGAIRTYSGSAIYMEHTSQIHINRCRFLRFMSRAIHASTVWNSHITNNYFIDCGHSSNSIATIEYDAPDDKCTSPWITDNLFEYSQYCDIYHINGTVNRSKILNNWTEGYGVKPSYAFIRWDGNYTKIHGNQIIGTYYGHHGILAYGTRNSITDNEITTVRYGIDAGDNNIIANNTLMQISSQAIRSNNHSQIIGNNITALSGQQYPIGIYPYNSYCIVEGNYIRDINGNGTRLIVLGSDKTNYSICDNKLIAGINTETGIYFNTSADSQTLIANNSLSGSFTNDIVNRGNSMIRDNVGIPDSSFTFVSSQAISGGTIIGNTLTTNSYISSATGIYANFISANTSNLEGSTDVAWSGASGYITVSGLVNSLNTWYEASGEKLSTISGSLSDRIDALGAFDPENYITSTNSITRFADSSQYSTDKSNFTSTYNWFTASSSKISDYVVSGDEYSKAYASAQIAIYDTAGGGISGWYDLDTGTGITAFAGAVAISGTQAETISVSDYIASTNAISRFSDSSQVNWTNITAISSGFDGRLDTLEAMDEFDEELYITSTNSIERFSDSSNVNLTTITNISSAIVTHVDNNHYDTGWIDTFSGNIDTRIDALGGFDPTDYITSTNSITRFSDSSNVNWTKITAISSGFDGRLDVLESQQPLSWSGATGFYTISSSINPRWVSSQIISGNAIKTESITVGPDNKLIFYTTGAKQIMRISGSADGDMLTITGPAESYDYLQIKGNSANAYGYITLQQAGDIKYDTTDYHIFKRQGDTKFFIKNNEHIFYSGATQQIFKIASDDGNGISNIYGCDATGDDLVIAANTVDTYPKINLQGNSSIVHDSGWHHLFRYADTTKLTIVDNVSNETTLQGGNVSGDDLILKASNLDIYPTIRLEGSGNIITSGNLYLPNYSISANIISGGAILTGDFSLLANTISGLIDPIYPSAAANKHYVDTISGALDARIDALGGFDPTDYIISTNAITRFADSSNIIDKYYPSTLGAGVSSAVTLNTTHRLDNTQAHSDYLLNNDDDTTTGTLTAKSFSGPLSGSIISGGNITTREISNSMAISGQISGMQLLTNLYPSKPTATNHMGEIIRVSGGAGEGTWVFMSVKNSADDWGWMQLGVTS